MIKLNIYKLRTAKINFFFVALFITTITGINAQSSTIITWISGPNTSEQLGIYGTLGIASTSNIPGARENSISWIDSSNHLWLFGGNGYSTTITQGRLNDLWKYNISTNEWTWVSGSNNLNVYGTYGTLGVANSSNIPGGRQNSITWKDSNGNLWLFGGSGFAASGALGYLNDLWKYDITTNQWTWVSGTNAINQTGNYGSLGVSNAANVPGARYGAVSWIENDHLYLFGGQTASSIRVNDLWKYDIATGEWTWISGSNIIDQNGIYGTQGITAPTNVPGARQAGISWIDNSNDFWMLGGYGFDYNGSASYLNDLWKYNVGTNEWTWINGADTTFQSANYGSLGVTAPTNRPGARQMSIASKDVNGDLWLFGAWGTIGPPFGRINDLWKYELSSNQWTWFAGDNNIDQLGIYGSLGVGDVNNIPGARRMSVSWTDTSGNFWLFGGNMSDGSGGSLLLNDLWKINISSNVGINTIVDPKTIVNIYPNPTNDKITVDISNEEEHSVIILDIMGKIIFQSNIQVKTQIDISSLNDGIYFIRIGNQTRKIIKY